MQNEMSVNAKSLGALKNGLISGNLEDQAYTQNWVHAQERHV